MAKESPIWGGRFREPRDPQAEAFTASLPFDRQLAFVDLEGSLAHLTMLVAQGILSQDEGALLRKGLEVIRQELSEGRFPWRSHLEDVHMNIEYRLGELVGPVAGKLHTARSRNDQVVTDLRLWLRGTLSEILQELNELRRVLVAEAERALDPPLILPGYTHLQRAMPVLLAHWFLAYYEMLRRDRGRIRDALLRLNESPLGAAALAGTGFPIDRWLSSELLGFTRPMRNSLDAVASRDFALEVLAALTIGQVHLSRMAEELVLYSSSEFGFLELPDAFSTGSSIMPHKKNPDVAELIRGKVGRVLGGFVALATVVKGLPLAYNSDLQEDKEPLFDAAHTYRTSLAILKSMLPKLRWRGEVMAQAAGSGFILATELADFLAARGLPFREAHKVVGQLVQECELEGKELSSLSLEDLRKAHPLFDAQAYELLRLQGAIQQRASYGGTAPQAVQKALEEIRRELEVEE
jgi:argininosuccinate lyase